MRLQQWKRLSAVNKTLRYQHRRVVVVTFEPDESDESFHRRVERWKAGEIVEGIAGTYEGGQVQFVGVRGVTPSR